MSGTDSPLRRFDVRSQDPEYAHDVLRKSFLDFSVRLSGGTDGFEFSQVGVATPTFSRARVRYSMTAEAETGPDPGPVMIDVVADGRLRAEVGRDEFRASPGVPVLLPTEIPGTVYETSDIVVDSLVLDRSVLHAAAASLFGIEPAGLSFLARTPLSPRMTDYWNRVVAHVDRTVLDDDEVATAPLAMTEAARSLAAAILMTFPNTGLLSPHNGDGQAWADPAVMRRALAYIEEHAHEDIGVDAIAAEARIGVRGLQALFRRHRDRTPLDELRRVRMVRAHADLQVADPERGDTVAAIAARWGFSNPGRFAVQYRQVYGRSPSDTLRS